MLLVVSIYAGCGPDNVGRSDIVGSETAPYVVVLGVAQDAGYPQANCQKACCKDVWGDSSKRRMVSCLGIVDPASKKCWLIDATPDFKDQLQLLTHRDGETYDLSGIFLTHAHIGHYTGLMHLGREVMGASNTPVYAMPRMAGFLNSNGPWSQLVSLGNIEIRGLRGDSSIHLSDALAVTPVLVPHRDEYSETVGYQIQGAQRSLLFIPDIDKWDKWNRDLRDEIRRHDAVLIDGSFYANGEIPNRDMSQIPHPFVVETMTLTEDLPRSELSKVHFIHLNHTNPLLDFESAEYKEVRSNGLYICEENKIFRL